MRKVSIILLGLFLYGISSAQDKYYSQVDSAIALGMKCLLITPGDLTFRNDYTEVDAFRTVPVIKLMTKPVITITGLDSLAKFTEVTPNWRSSYYQTLHMIDRDQSFYEFNESWPKSHSDSSYSEHLESTSLEVLTKSLDKLSKKKRLLRTQKPELSLLMDNVFWQLHYKYVSIRKNLGNRYDTLPVMVREIILEDTLDQHRTPAELDELQKREEEYSKWVANNIPSEFDQDEFWSQSILMLAIDTLSNYLRSEEFNAWLAKRKNKEYLLRKKNKFGEFIIGGRGPNHYTGAPVLIIDLGGDDVYELSNYPYCSNQVIIDLSGNDTYKAMSDLCFGSGYFGTGILVDESGDDIYMGKNFCLGSGLFGVGILVDKNGNDKYFGDTYTQGAGGWGIGILADLEGSDTYNGALFSQGFGFVAGCGMLIDRSGNDNYFAGGKYKDILRYKDHYLSLSQGFAYGIRPYMSGGIGLLFDYSGNDIYNADIFGQGSSYWWSWGGLYDKEGNDYYSCFQYAQGCGTHMTLGTLVDEAGDDIYRVNGVGQGCGHDYSAGILLDKAGNDNYYANGLSQGAGNANGFGILIDQEGDDGFYVKDKSNTQGYGNPRREFGSIGILLDLKGNDSYSGNGTEGSWWSTGSKWGMGLDLEESSLTKNLSESDLNYTNAKTFPGPDLRSLPPVDWNVASKTAALAVNDSLQKSVDSLFILASAINVSDMDKVEPAKQALRDMKDNSIPYLVKKLDSRDAREIQTLIDILGKMGESATLPLASALKSEDIWMVRNTGRVLAELKDKQAVPYLLQVLNHSDHQARGNALTALGNARDTIAFSWVAEMLKDTVQLVRKSAAYALGELPDERGVDYLIYALDDPHYSVRMAAAEALGKFGEKAAKQLEGEIRNSGSLDRRLLCISALGKAKTPEGDNFLWQIYEKEDWRGKGVIVEALGESDSVKNMVRLNSLKEKEKHPYVLGKLGQILAKYKTSN